MPLYETQQHFIDSLMTTGYNEAGLLKGLEDMPRLTPERQLDIYRRNINGAYQKVLGQIYPACQRILGEAYFNQLCRAYRFKYPSSHPDLNRYGAEFTEYLDEHVSQHAQLADFIYLKDLATLEWYWHATYYHQDDLSFDFTRLQQLTPAQQSEVVLMLADSAVLLASEYPVADIWQANREPGHDNQLFEHDGSTSYYLIYRRELVPQLERLSMTDYQHLSAIKSGCRLEHLVEEYGGSFNERLPEYIQRGWVSDFQVVVQ